MTEKIPGDLRLDRIIVVDDVGTELRMEGTPMLSPLLPIIHEHKHPIEANSTV